jgi:hypothetical protein
LVPCWCRLGAVLVLGAVLAWCRAGVGRFFSHSISLLGASSNRVNFRVPCLIDRIFALLDCLVKYTLLGLLIFPANKYTCYGLVDIGLMCVLLCMISV